MDCLRSGLEGPDVVAVSEAGDVLGACWVEPNKSRPSSESPGRGCLDSAASAIDGGGFENEGSVVLGLGGALIGLSPNRSV